MADPTPYTRLYNFTDFQTVNPNKPLPATQLDNELNAVALTVGQIKSNLGQLQRSDGALANQTVTPESLSAGALALISQGEYNPRGAWASATAYGPGDVVSFNGATYLALVAHTSVAAFATDLDANKWLLIANGALSGGANAVDLYEGNGSQTAFTLSYTYSGSNSAVVFVGGVAQIPVQDFSISGTTITFTTAPASPSIAGRKNVMVRGTGVEAQLAANAATTQAANAAGSAAAAAGSATSAATSATNAAASAATASTQATNASTSAGTASTQAANAATSATNAAASAATASTGASSASTSATSATASATSASTSAATATTQATNASNSATAAASSATSAAASATTATNKASDATGAASSATTSAANASTSASAASNSANNAATSATSALNSATSATNSSSSASTSASNAANSASAASTSASNAATSAAAAGTSATTAATQATNAATSATNAANSSTAAAASATAAAASYDAFDDRYLGAKATNPTLDNDGNALLTGALYFNTSTNSMMVFNGTTWIVAASAVNGTLGRQVYTATAGQTTFAVTYDVGFVDVYLNGSKLTIGDDFTATNGTSVVLATGAAVGDSVDIIAFGSFLVANTYTIAQADALLAATAKLNSTQSFTKAQRGAVVALTDGATITPDFALANNLSVTLAGSRTLANPTNLAAGQSGAITITQDATGSRTLAYGSNWKFPSGAAPVLTTTGSAVDVLVYYVESSTRITARLLSDVK